VGKSRLAHATLPERMSKNHEQSGGMDIYVRVMSLLMILVLMVLI